MDEGLAWRWRWECDEKRVDTVNRVMVLELVGMRWKRMVQCGLQNSSMVKERPESSMVSLGKYDVYVVQLEVNWRGTKKLVVAMGRL